MEDLTGQTVQHYKILDQIDKGGYGIVYQAKDLNTGELVVIKTIYMNKVTDPKVIDRFEQEAEIIAELDHAHIVPLYKHWHTSDQAYIVMRYLSGGSLRESLKNEGAWSLSQTTHLMHHLTQALTAAHTAHIIHRDVKPANILLDDDHNAYLSDFGLAKRLRYDAHLTEPDTIIGSPAYQAPEQILDEEITPRTDVYALGLTLYQTLTGQHPYTGKTGTLGLLAKQLRDPVPPIHHTNPNIPLTVNAVIQKATAKSAQARYASVDEMYQAFCQAVKVMS